MKSSLFFLECRKHGTPYYMGEMCPECEEEFNLGDKENMLEECIQLDDGQIRTVCCSKMFDKNEKEWIIDAEGGEWCPECVPTQLYNLSQESHHYKGLITVLKDLLEEAEKWTPLNLSQRIKPWIK